MSLFLVLIFGNLFPWEINKAHVNSSSLFLLCKKVAKVFDEQLFMEKFCFNFFSKISFNNFFLLNNFLSVLLLFI